MQQNLIQRKENSKVTFDFKEIRQIEQNKNKNNDLYQRTFKIVPYSGDWWRQKIFPD